MWLKFLNPKSDPLITKTQFVEKLEKLARGKFTDSKTIISENFAQGLYLMLVARDTTVESGPDLGQIRITKLRKKLTNDELPIEYLNQTLRKDCEFVLDEEVINSAPKVH